jgi:hypothetical protein
MHTLNISAQGFFGTAMSASLILLACSCASSSVKMTWKAPEATQPVRKVAVVAVAERGLLRQGFENRLATQLIAAGTPAAVTYDQLPLAAIKQDKQAAAQQFRASGADSVLILRLLTTAVSYHEVQPGGPRYTGTVTGFDSIGWYDYYSLGFMDLSPTYGSLTEKMYLEASLHDLQTEKRLWAGVTRTVLKEQMDRVGEMDPLVQKIVAAMRQDGVIR